MLLSHLGQTTIRSGYPFHCVQPAVEPHVHPLQFHQVSFYRLLMGVSQFEREGNKVLFVYLSPCADRWLPQDPRKHCFSDVSVRAQS